MELTLTDAGVTVREGEFAAFTAHTALQRSVFPVFGAVGDKMVGLGTAVCVAPGLFITARHVVADLDHDVPPSWTVPFENMWLYFETDQPIASDPGAVHGGLLDVLFANPHSETDLATLTVRMSGNIARWVRPVTLALRMPDIGEQIDCFGYDLATAEGPLNADLVTLVVERRLCVSTGRVTSQQPTRRIGGYHRTSPGFTTTAATPRGMSGGPVFDARNHVIGFNSGSTAPSAQHPGWDSFAAGTAAALELNFITIDNTPGTAEAAPDIAERTVQLAQLVAEDRVACHMYDSFHVDPATGSAGYAPPAEPAVGDSHGETGSRDQT
ncbi:MAG TPA: serine protease [Frankiaceae bacterium]|nr:serine protease [Frankiaceae bacterium]